MTQDDHQTLVKMLRAGAHEQIAEFLHEHRERLDAGEWSALHALAIRGDVSLVRLAIELGCDPARRSGKMMSSPLVMAAWGGQRENLELLASLIDPPKTTELDEALRRCIFGLEKVTSLDAAGVDQAGTVRVLCSLGADPNAHEDPSSPLDPAGSHTTLFAAAMRRGCSDDVLDAFIAAGGEPGAACAVGRLERGYVSLLRQGRFAIAARIFDAGVDEVLRSDEPFVALVQAGAPREVMDEWRVRLARFGDVRAFMGDGLFECARADDPSTALALVELGADPYAFDAQGRNMRTVARLWGSEAMVAWCDAAGVVSQDEFEEDVRRADARRAAQLEQERARADKVMGTVTDGPMKGMRAAVERLGADPLEAEVCLFGRWVPMQIAAGDFRADEGAS